MTIITTSLGRSLELLITLTEKELRQLELVSLDLSQVPRGQLVTLLEDLAIRYPYIPLHMELEGLTLVRKPKDGMMETPLICIWHPGTYDTPGWREMKPSSPTKI